MKKIISVFLISTIILSLCTAPVFADTGAAIVDFSTETPTLTNVSSLLPSTAIKTEYATVGGESCIKLLTGNNTTTGQGLYYGLNIDNKFMSRFKNGEGVDVEIEYYDSTGHNTDMEQTHSKKGSFVVRYDGRNDTNSFAHIIRIEGTDTWKTRTIHLQDPYFVNRCSGGDIKLEIFSQITGFCEGDVYIKKITVKKSTAVFPFDISSEAVKTGNIFKDNESVSLPVTLKNVDDVSDKTYNLTLDVIVRNENGQKVYEASREIVQSGSSTYNVDIPYDKYGAYDVEFMVYSADKSISGRLETTFSRIKTNEEVNLKSGVCTHYRLEGRNPAITVPLAVEAGASIIRNGITWDKFELEKGVYALNEETINALNEVSKQGIEITMGLASTNKFYDDGKVPTTEEGLEGWYNYVYNLVSQVKGKCSTFEVWNEFHHTAYANGWVTDENRTNPPVEVAEIYVKLLKTAYEAAKAANPACTVIGLGGLPGVWPGWVEAVMAAGAGNYMDVASMHEYDMNAWPERKMVGWMENVISIMEKYGYGDMPIWITESGWSSADVGLINQRDYGVRAYVLYQSLGIDRLIWYDFKSDGWDPYDQENMFGLIYRHDDPTELPYSAKPAFLAYANMNSVLGNAEFISMDINENNTYNARFKDKNNRFVNVIWNPYSTIKEEFDLGYQNAIITDINGNEKNAVFSGGKIQLGVTPTPVYVTQPDIEINSVNYTTGEIEITARVDFNPADLTGVYVLKPGKKPSDILTDKTNALAYFGQPFVGTDGTFELTFVAEEEGEYTLYAKNGEAMEEMMGIYYYKPLGASIYLSQNDVQVQNFSEIDKTQPLSVSATIENLYGAECDVKIICGFYNDGVMVNTKIAEGYVTADELLFNKTFGINLSEIGEFDNISVFIWKGSTALIPVMDKYEIKQQ